MSRPVIVFGFRRKVLHTIFLSSSFTKTYLLFLTKINFDILVGTLTYSPSH